MDVPIYWPTPRRKGPERIVLGTFLFLLWFWTGIWAFATAGLFGLTATVLLPLLVAGSILNRQLVTAYRNEHTSFDTVTVEVKADDTTYHVMEHYDSNLPAVRDDIVAFLREAGGVTPVTTRIRQRDAGSVSAFDNKDRKHAEITVHVGYNAETVQPEQLKDNLAKAVRGDDRVQRFKRVRFGGPVADQRDNLSLTGDDYKQLGAAVNEREGLTDEDIERLLEAEDDIELDREET